MLQFLQSLDAGQAASRLKVYNVAISMCHNEGWNGWLGGHQLILKFMKGVVLEDQTGSPFEPVKLVSLKHLSIKTAFLLAITSSKRIGEIYVLSVSAKWTRWGSVRTSVSLCFIPLFLPKDLPVQHVIRTFC